MTKSLLYQSPIAHREHVGPRRSQATGRAHVDVQASLYPEKEGHHAGKQEVEASQRRHKP